jgi:hypothetical protein
VDEVDEDVQLEYQVEYLNTGTLNFPGFPMHRLLLKVGSVVMLSQNLSIIGGLCNGTHLQIVTLHKHAIAGKIMTGDHAGEVVFHYSSTPVAEGWGLGRHRRPGGKAP